MSTIQTPNMNMTLPVPLSEPGPAWATEINNALGNAVDSHDHSNGKGVPVTPAGLNITGPLTFQGNQATNLAATVFSPQASDPSATTLVYVKGADLYYKDLSGNVIRLTAAGAIVGTSGSIANLVSPASATFISGSGTFQFQQNTGVAGNMDVGTAVLRYPGSYPSVSGTNAIAVQVPSSIGASYALTLPGAPPASSTAFVTMDTSGNLAPSVSTVAGITQSMLAARATGATVPAGGVGISASSSTFSSTANSYTAVTNLSVTITTTGRPVAVLLQPAGASASITVAASTGVAGAVMQVLRGASVVFNAAIGTSASSITLPPGTLGVDIPAAGVYTYTVQVLVGANNAIAVSNCALVAYEL